MDIPFELIEVIIEQLADSATTLRACTLVCKSWLPTASRVLFRNFTLHSGRRFGIDQPIFPRYVSHLTIADNFRGQLQNADLKDTLSLFHRVRVLSIVECNDIHLIPLVSAAFPHIRHLNLDGVALGSPQSLRTFVAAFADLESLSVYPILPEETEADSLHLNDPPPPPRLHTMSYKSDYVPRAPFLRWISAHPPALEHLTLQRLAPAELQSTGALLQALGPRLQTLDISFKGRSSPADISTHVHLDANTHLHTLTLHIALRHFYGMRHPHSPADAPLALLTPIFPTLRRATLALYVSFLTQLATLDWGAFDAAFSQRAPSLETLAVQVHGAGPWGTPETREPEHIANGPMPLCQARGTFGGLEYIRRPHPVPS